MIGSALENHWGSLRYIIYLGLSWLGSLIAIGIANLGGAPEITTGYLSSVVPSLFLAFATLFPNHELHVYFIPVKVKWLALLLLGYLVYQGVGEPAIVQFAIPFFYINYPIFFAGYWLTYFRRKQGKVVIVAEEKRQEREPFHVCSVCGITDKEAPERKGFVSIPVAAAEGYL